MLFLQISLNISLPLSYKHDYAQKGDGTTQLSSTIHALFLKPMLLTSFCAIVYVFRHLPSEKQIIIFFRFFLVKTCDSL